jgi:hypothetical protein
MLKFWDKSAARLIVGEEPIVLRLKYSGWLRLNWSLRLKLNVPDPIGLEYPVGK